MNDFQANAAMLYVRFLVFLQSNYYSGFRKKHKFFFLTETRYV